MSMQVNASEFAALRIEDIQGLIQKALSGNNDYIKEATKILKGFAKHPNAIKILTQILVTSQSVGDRQMASVLLARHLLNLFSALQPAEQNEFKRLLLTQFHKETSLLVQKSLAVLIGTLVTAIGIANWPELQELRRITIQGAPESPSTFVLLNSLLTFDDAPAELYGFILQALKNGKCSHEAINCVVSFFDSQNVTAAHGISLIQLWQQEKWSSDIAQSAFQALTTLCERRVKGIDEITIWICDKILAVKNAPHQLRVSATDYLFSLIELNVKTLNSNEKVLRKVVQTVCIACSEPIAPNSEELEQDCLQEICIWLIESLSVEVKGKKIYPILFEAATSLINANDSNMNNTGYLVLGCMSEGCRSRLRNNLQNPIMNTLMPKGLSSPHAEVRGAAIRALCSFCDNLIPQIVSYHPIIVPSMMSYLNDMSTKVAEKAIIAIDKLFDSISAEEIMGYIPIVVPQMIATLLNSTSTPIMRAAAMSTIGGALVAADIKFEPYVEGVIKTCEQVFQIPNEPALIALKAENISTLGKLANIFCGPNYPHRQLFYERWIKPSMEAVFTLLTAPNQDPDIKESCFIYFYQIVNAIQSKAQPFFDQLLATAFQSCLPKEAPNKTQFSRDSDSEEEETEMQIFLAQYNEKGTALHTIGELAAACPLKFMPHFPLAMERLQAYDDFFYEDIRSEACLCYTNLAYCIVKAKHEGVIPKYSHGLPCLQRLHPDAEQFIHKEYLPKILSVINNDSDKKVRAVAIESLEEFIKKVGPAAVDMSISPVKDALISVLSRVTGQNGLESEEEEEITEGAEEDIEDTEAETFEAACDLMMTLAEVLRDGFTMSVNELLPYLSMYLSDRQDNNDYIQMLGVLSELCKWMPTFIIQHHEEIMKVIQPLYKLWDSEINRNISYTLAEMVEKGSYVMARHLQLVLIMLKEIYEHASSKLVCKQNALAAICRIIYVFTPPMPYEHFLSTLFSSLPFTADPLQETTILKCIVFLRQKKPELLLPHVGALSQILENDLTRAVKIELEDPLKTSVAQILMEIKSQ